MHHSNDYHDGYGGVAREGHQMENDNQVEDMSGYLNAFSASIAAGVLAHDLKRIATGVSELVGMAGLGTERVIHYESVMANAVAALRDLSLVLGKMEDTDGQAEEEGQAGEADPT